MRRFYAVASLFCALGPLLLTTGCEDLPIHLDPLAMNDRDVGGKPIDYNGLMRIAAAAHAGSDLASAVAIYRRAASMSPAAPAPFVGLGNALLEMNNVSEAIIAFNSALERDHHDPEALRGLARAYLLTGRVELAGHPLAEAYKLTPNDPKLLQLIGVADDFAGQHEEAQARYRRGLELAPRDPGLAMNLALSLSLTGDYRQAIDVLRPVALAAPSTPGERQTLALIYGLSGNRAEAERIGRIDLDPQAVQHNLAFYDSLRRLSPADRARAVKSLSTPAAPEGTTAPDNS